MPYRDVIVTIIIIGSLPVCLARPWIGILMWSWIGYMNPHRLTWSFAYTLPFAMMVALATLIGLLFTKERKPLPRTIEVYLLLALWVLFSISTFFAFNPTDAWDQFDKVSKILLVTFVTMLLFQEAEKLKTLLYVIALSIGFYGLKGGIWALATGGGNQVLGPAESFISGNTEIGLAINMVLPILLLLSRYESRRWMKMGLRATFFFGIFGSIFTYSRGAFLGLGLVLTLTFVKSRVRFILIPLAIVVALFGKSLVPEQWLNRMGTIQTYEQDRSANMRLNAWWVSYRLALDNPIIGAGFRPFGPAVYLRYSPDEKWNDWQDAHSIYFQVLAEHGFTGLALYLALIASTLISLRRVRRRARGDPSLEFHGATAQMLEVSLLGFLVSGAFLSMSYFDLYFHLVAITVMLKVLVLQEAPAPVVARPAPASPVGARPPGRGPVSAPVRRPALPGRTEA
jgi:probable O-glycosylation ligase (exosortase A-associated)